ncbi:four-carbon acid sugar kinase family protein [Halostagnicola bangensis]
MDALIVADDFTGAMDTGHGFAADGRTVRVRLAGPSRTAYEPVREMTLSPSELDCDVLTVDMNTRDVSPETAREAVSGLLNVDVPLVYKKIDSTLRGNVVSEVDGAMDAIGPAVAVVAPAFPSTGRRTVDGQHLVNGVSLPDADYDVSTSNLQDFFESSRYRVVSLGTETIARGTETVRSALEAECESEPVVVTCDAATETHLETIASAGTSLDAPVLFVGSGGLAAALSASEALGAREQSGAHLLSEADLSSGADLSSACPTGGSLGIVGSINEQTLEQLSAVPDEYVYRLNPAAAVRKPKDTGREAVTELVDRLDSYGTAVVTGATERADVERAREAGAELPTDSNAGGRVAAALATAAAETTERASPSSLVCTGGSVARSVLESLEATAIDLTGESVGDGIPEGQIADGPAAGTHVVTKAGGFGSKGSIVNCLNFVCDDDDRN